MSSDKIVMIDGFPVHFVKNGRARRVVLKQNAKGDIILTCPQLCPKVVAIAFARKQRAWIAAHVQYGPKEIVFKAGDHVSLLGKNYLLVHGRLTALSEDTLTISGDPVFFHRRVCSYAQKLLMPYIRRRVEDLAKQIDQHVGRITLRNTSSRWGSCSSNHNLSFCWKIAFAPLEVIDYLLAHEVAHLAQMNHSPQFWAVVDQLTEHRKFAERWLKTNGRTLQSIQ